MGDSSETLSEIEPNTIEQVPLGQETAKIALSFKNNENSQNLFPDSPVYEPDEDVLLPIVEQYASEETIEPQVSEDPILKTKTKRKLSDSPSESNTKLQKIHDNNDQFVISTQTLDDEVSELTAGLNFDKSLNTRLAALKSGFPTMKRSNSVNLSSPKTPRPAKLRPTSVDVTILRRTPRRIQNGSFDKLSVKSCNYEPEVPSPKPTNDTDIYSDNDSQDIHLVLSSPSSEELSNNSDQINIKTIYSSEPVLVKDRKDFMNYGKVQATRSEGYTYSDQSSNLSQPKPDNKGKATTDLESTDSMGSMLDSPDIIPTVTSKLISKLSNGNSSTPTEIAAAGKVSANNDSTPDMTKNNNISQRGKNESFRVSNNTTPSTISPLQNGHSLPINTPHLPLFDVHVSHNEDGEFLSLYIVRTDNDLGMDMCKEYQRISKRFTIDSYMADVSVSNSPSSVTSGGMIQLPNRTSFASTVSSTSTASSTSTSSNRTSDGNFVVPQPPRKSVSLPTSSVKGYDALIKKLQDIFSHIRENAVEEERSISEDKISVAIQTSTDINITNGNASPKEVHRCDKVTPKSSLKKTKVRGRRHMAGKTKRTVLPTQPEEPWYVESINSPEMVPVNGENKHHSPIKSPDEEKAFSTAITSPGLSKLKQKRPMTSPRPATPTAKPFLKTEFSGFEPGTVVLAKWINKRYYSGIVGEMTGPNKYLIKFYDGRTKTILDEFIFFGDKKKLCLKGHSVYAMIDEEQNYEPALVLDVEENINGDVTYKCTTDGDTMVIVTASQLYLTEDQARSLKESLPRQIVNVNSPRRHNTDLDLDNIIQGPRSARSRDRNNSSLRKRVASPRSPKASTSGLKMRSSPSCRRRLASESSEFSESSNSAPISRIEEVAGVEPEVQRTPRKIDGVKAGPLQLKGAAKQNIGKKNSKLTKFENDEDTNSVLGPIPSGDNKLFAGLHFLLTCTEQPRSKSNNNKSKSERNQENRHYSSEEDGETTSSMIGTDTEDLEFSDRPFNKERLKEQLEAGGGTVYSHFDDVPKTKYSVCKLIAPRPCLTAKYIQCLAADIRSVSHAWIILSCIKNVLYDTDAFILPAGWSLMRNCFVNWVPPIGKRNTSFFKDKTILLCGDQDTFVKFWQGVCTLAGATTRVVNDEDLNMSDAYVVVTEWDCPHEVQNKANQDNIPLVSTTWVIQCLIEDKVIEPTSNEKFSFMYTETE